MIDNLIPPDGENRQAEAAYRISGFRSLTDFSISLNRGLNVLVGPNGSGKTNFIEFLDFLSAVLTRDAATAVSRVGGVSRVFSAEQSKNKSATVSATVSGIADLSMYSDGEEHTLFGFDYEIEIKFSREHSAVFIAHELVRFRRLHSSSECNVPIFPVGSISVRRQASKLNDPPIIKVGRRLQSSAARNPLRITSRYSYGVKSETIHSSIVPLASDESILSVRPGRSALEAIRVAIMRGQSFNLIPERAKAPDEITKAPTILHDGSGLTSTLFHLTRNDKPGRRRTAPHRRFRPEQLEYILDWTRLVFPELKDVAVSADPHTGKYLANLIVGDDELKIPLQSASDGTVKWLALVTLIITRGGVYSIEEPENFLHPRMQQLLVDLVRDYSADPDKPGYFIMSTHSETIINKCDPEELILFNFDGGSTKCSRLKNAHAVREEINKTGFGLGYYYANNAVS